MLENDAVAIYNLRDEYIRSNVPEKDAINIAITQFFANRIRKELRELEKKIKFLQAGEHLRRMEDNE